jgi:tripartite-type tricarboxylate transporter receptor subunit TctC
VPTMAEAGYPQLDIGTWFALVAPAATPHAIVTQLNQRMVKILNMPDVRMQLGRQGVEPDPGTTEEAADFLKTDVARWGKILKDAGITLD